jgi:dolichol-phosphate mannosyltransferase
MSSLVVVPSYNEAQNVLPLIADVLSASFDLEVLVVDDNSPDGTGDLVARAAENEPRLRLLRRPAKLGLGSAYLAGFRHGLEGGFDRILTMDSDYSHHPRYLAPLLAAMSGADVAVGSRYVPGGGIVNWPLRRRLLSRFGNLYTRTLLRLPVHDCTAGFRCHTREVIESVDPFSIRSSGYAFLEEMLWRVHCCGFRIVEVPIVFEDRTRGDSKIDQREIYRAIWHVLYTAFRRPPVHRRACSSRIVGTAPRGDPL